MTRIETGFRDFSYYDSSDGDMTLTARNILVTEASEDAVDRVINADVDESDGRSQWVWIRFPNGDLFLAVAPQGETYFAVEGDTDSP